MIRLAPWLALLLVLPGCGKREEVVVTETRPMTMRDRGLKWDATDDQRFGSSPQSPVMPPMMAGDAAESPVEAGSVPEGWTEAPTSMFRLLNYTFGEGGEVYVSASRGGILENVNRWLGQFGQPALTTLDGLESVEAAGYRGVWVTVDGRFGGAMGAEARDGWALRGVVMERGGEILTLKMMGPRGAVEAEMPRLRSFVGELKPAP
jgi:hypothetical protein